MSRDRAASARKSSLSSRRPTVGDLSPEAADVLIKWLCTAVAKSAPSDPATAEAIQYVITGQAERVVIAATRATPAPAPLPDHSGIGAPGCAICDPRTYIEARADLLDRLAEGVRELEFASGWVTWSDDLVPTADKFVRLSAVLALIEEASNG
jgi:hypothetical protein